MMQKKIQLVRLILPVITVIFSQSSCKKFLEVAPKETVAQELAITDKESLNTAIRGAYRALGAPGYYGEGYVNLGFVPSGDVVYNVADNISDFNFRSTDGAFSNPWNAIYETINIVNNIIVKAPEVNDAELSENERNTILGEAHFIRALAYFDLARGWGGVPLRTQSTTDFSADNTTERSSLEDTYNFVKEELLTAETLLPESVNRIRATKYTVWALAARLALYTKNWNDAIEYSSRLIALQDNYSLVTPFSGWFKNNATQTQESIFEIAFSAQNQSGLRTRMSLLARGGEYRYRPGNQVIATLQNPATGGERLALVDSSIQSGVTQYAGALYYRSPATDPSYVLRIAEQYLIRAEAEAQNELLEDAKTDLNTVRQRAGLLNTTAVTQIQILDAILEERRLEFLWEAHRYFDLVRTGKLKERIGILKPNLTIEPFLNLFPIPINEVTVGGLEQNPRY